jgi:hypothetical protein
MVDEAEESFSRKAPLAVCVNDCEIDCGQPWQDLVLVCFKVGCAFAELRWGSPDRYGPAGCAGNRREK